MTMGGGLGLGNHRLDIVGMGLVTQNQYERFYQPPSIKNSMKRTMMGDRKRILSDSREVMQNTMFDSNDHKQRIAPIHTQAAQDLHSDLM